MQKFSIVQYLLSFINQIEVLAFGHAFEVVVAFDIDHVGILKGIVNGVHVDFLKNFVVITREYGSRPLRSFALVKFTVKVVKGDYNCCNIVA